MFELTNIEPPKFQAQYALRTRYNEVQEVLRWLRNDYLQAEVASGRMAKERATEYYNAMQRVSHNIAINLNHIEAQACDETMTADVINRKTAVVMSWRSRQLAASKLPEREILIKMNVLRDAINAFFKA